MSAASLESFALQRALQARCPFSAFTSPSSVSSVQLHPKIFLRFATMNIMHVAVPKHALNNVFRHAPVIRSTVRTLLTAPTEPPLDSKIPEKPCTFILAEDSGFYNASWRDTCSIQLPANNGLSYSQWSLSDSTSSFDEALDEMKLDLHGIPHIVLIARGPWMCWMAQFYLEDLPLAGLVMIDPLPLDDRNGINQFELVYEKNGLECNKEFVIFQDFMNHERSLQLEPGVVPMLVLHTVLRPAFKRLADNTARRHSDPNGPFGSVPMLKLECPDGEAIDLISEWIDDRVL